LCKSHYTITIQYLTTNSHMIKEDILLKFGACKMTYKKGDFLFNEGDYPKFFYQILSGSVKMNNFNDEGKEFIQGIFSTGQTFGEPPLFINKPYPSNAMAISHTTVYAIHKEAFFRLLLTNPEVNLAVSEVLSQRLYYKSIMASELSSQDAEHRIIKLIDYFKEEIGVPSDVKYKVSLTRQQIADLTGLRVETVIRAIKTLEQKGGLKIKDRKIFR
jgi:CRP-like cAMP-binding protein